MPAQPPRTLLALPRYAALGASSRVRLLQFLPALADAGIAVRPEALLSDEYLRRKYAGHSVAGPVLQAYASRAAQLLRTPDADVVWIEKELWPMAPAWLERLAWHGKPVVLDYDDAIFHTYDQHRSALVRATLGRKIDALMRHATLVVAGNDYLAGRARSAGARRVEILPTVVPFARYDVEAAAVRREPAHAGPLRVGWIGSPATIGYVQQLAAPLAALAQHVPFVLRLIGAQLDLPGVPTEHVPWSEAGEVRALAALDVGLMPLPDSPWERGKCGYKLIQYMACGVPVVASPVGANRQIVRPGLNGFLASTADEWLQVLSALADDPALRQRLGDQGRADVLAHYSLESAAPRLAGWLHEVAAAAR